jgi:hypothetical protein
MGYIIDFFSGLSSFLRSFRVSTALIAQHSAQQFLLLLLQRGGFSPEAPVSVDGRLHLIRTSSILVHTVAA